MRASDDLRKRYEWARKLAELARFHNPSQRLTRAAARPPEALADARHQLIPHFTIGVELLLSIAFGSGD